MAKSQLIMQTRSEHVCSVFHGHWRLYQGWMKFHLITCVGPLRERGVHVGVSDVVPASAGGVNFSQWGRVCAEESGAGSLSLRVSANARGC